MVSIYVLLLDKWHCICEAYFATDSHMFDELVHRLLRFSLSWLFHYYYFVSYLPTPVFLFYSSFCLLFAIVLLQLHYNIEPGYERDMHTERGRTASKEYNK